MTASKILLHGTPEALVLETLSHGPLHRYAIGRGIEERAGSALLIEEGALYPALHRLEARGLLPSEWGTSDLGRRAKLFRARRSRTRWSSTSSCVCGSTRPGEWPRMRHDGWRRHGSETAAS